MRAISPSGDPTNMVGAAGGGDPVEFARHDEAFEPWIEADEVNVCYAKVSERRSLRLIRPHPKVGERALHRLSFELCALGAATNEQYEGRRHCTAQKFIQCNDQPDHSGNPT